MGIRQEVQTQQDEQRAEESSQMSGGLLGLNREVGQGIKISTFRALTGNIWSIGNFNEAWGYLQNFDLICLQETRLKSNREKQGLGGLDKTYIQNCKSTIRENEKKTGLWQGC